MNRNNQQAVPNEIVNTLCGVSYIIVGHGTDVTIPRVQHPGCNQPAESIARYGAVHLNSARAAMNMLDAAIIRTREMNAYPGGEENRRERIQQDEMSRQMIENSLRRIVRIFRRYNDGIPMTDWQRNNATVELNYVLLRLHSRIIVIELCMWQRPLQFNPEAIEAIRRFNAFAPTYDAVVAQLRARRAAELAINQQELPYEQDPTLYE
jgi:hypothetical protein